MALVLVLTAAMLFLGPSPALGVIYLQDGFENVPAATTATPDISGDYDPEPFDWVVVEVNPTDVQVSSYVGVGGPSSLAPNGGAQYLALTRVAGGYQVLAAVSNGIDPFYMKFDAYIPSTNPSPYGALYIRNGTGQQDQIAVGIVGGQTNFNYLGFGLTPWISAGAGANVVFDAWKTVGIQVNSFGDGLGGSGSYDLYYDNALMASGLPYWSADGGTFEFAFGLANGDKYYVDNVEVGSGPLPTTFLPGDVNFDGVVDIFDINLVSANWGSPGGPTGDANGDGNVDIFDINLISANWTVVGGGTAVPEPASAALAALALVGLLIRSCQETKRA